MYRLPWPSPKRINQARHDAAAKKPSSLRPVSSATGRDTSSSQDASKLSPPNVTAIKLQQGGPFVCSLAREGWQCAIEGNDQPVSA